MALCGFSHAFLGEPGSRNYCKSPTSVLGPDRQVSELHAIWTGARVTSRAGSLAQQGQRKPLAATAGIRQHQRLRPSACACAMRCAAESSRIWNQAAPLRRGRIRAASLFYPADPARIGPLDVPTRQLNRSRRVSPRPCSSRPSKRRGICPQPPAARRGPAGQQR